MSSCIVPQEVLKQLDNYYNHIQRIGEGGYSEVYFGVDKITENHVALKIIPVNTDDLRHRFLQEHKILQELKEDPHINSIRKTLLIKTNSGDFGIFAMDKMDMDLLNFVLTYSRIPEAECKLIFQQICIGVMKCHSKGISHLDLKPDNILLQFKEISNDERILTKVQLCDFGLARRWQSKKKIQKIIRSGDPSIIKYDGIGAIGTLEYRAIEIQNKESRISLTKADIWSLGVILFSCLTGMFPFSYDNNELGSY